MCEQAEADEEQEESVDTSKLHAGGECEEGCLDEGRLTVGEEGNWMF